MIDLSDVRGFEWDEGNVVKNWETDKVSQKECEEVFVNHPRVIVKDTKHSQVEDRFVILGITNKSRKLTIIFTLRGDKIRVISARDQNRGRERNMFKQKGK